MSYKKGVDLSSYQVLTDAEYDALAKAVDFAILRASFTGYGTGVTITYDKQFEKHYAELSKRGVPLGAYHYSCANTPDKARDEAEYFKNRLMDKEFLYPVFFDVENEKWQGTLSRRELTDVCIAFCDSMEKSGYYVGVYANKYWLAMRLDEARLKPYDIWIAHYTDASDESKYKNYALWQHTETGRIPGVTVPLDLNISYIDYPPIIKRAGLNGTKTYTEFKIQKLNPDEKEIAFIKHILETFGYKVVT